MPDPTPARRQLRILGIDPGSRITGWGLIGAGAPARILDCGRIRLEAIADPAERLAALHRDLTELVGALRPDSAAVESPFHGKNSRSALRLAQARGVILAALAGAGVPVHEYTPATVKKSVTGNGRAPKEQVQGMVLHLLAAPRQLGGSHDVSDALAIALCHAAVAGRGAALADAASRRLGARSPSGRPAAGRPSV